MSDDAKLDCQKLGELYTAVCAGGVQDDKNLFEMASLKEYRHSAILGYILARKVNGRYIHLESLVKRIMPTSEHKGIAEAQVGCEYFVNSGKGANRPIDVLCEFNGKALIIENKCRGAGDQGGQIVDYWEGVKKKGKPNQAGKYEDEDLFVLYLPPMNEIKGPATESKGLLFEGRLRDHLMVYSYRSLILPWLKEDVLPRISYGHGVLIDSLKSYIDMLEGIYGARSAVRDERSRELEAFMSARGLKDLPNKMVWDAATNVLLSIERELTEKRNAEDGQHSDDLALKLSELRASIWRIRAYLREQRPLLDPDNLIYEVYWMLRNNPTSFGAKYMHSRLDSGWFFVDGRKGSIWDQRTIKDADRKDHYLELVCDSDCLIKFLNSDKTEERAGILRFGIGGLGQDCARSLLVKFKDQEYCGEYVDNADWLQLRSENTAFQTALSKDGGEKLWAVAEAIADCARKFSELLKCEGFVL